MQMMNRITPFFSGFISLNLPGGVTLYFLVSNLFRVAQQTLMYRYDPNLRSHMEDVKDVRSKAASQPAGPKKSLMAGLREQAETRDANRRSRQRQWQRKNNQRLAVAPSQPVAA